jgi:hypothetical protein
VIKLPGTAAVYALSMALFGQTSAGIHLGLLLANVMAIVLVFLLAKRWFGADVGLIAGATYALMSVSWAVSGGAAHATQFVMPAALGGILLLLRSLESGRIAALFWSGLLFGFAFILKQPGILFGAFGGLLLLAHELKTRSVNWMICLKKSALFCLGIILPFAVLCLICWRAGVFERFWRWSFTVAGGGWYSWPLARIMLAHFLQWARESGQFPFWCLAGLVLPFVFWMPAAQSARLPFPAFCGVSILAVSIGFVFNRHYFVLMLPAVGMLIGLGIVEARQLLKNSKTSAFLSHLPTALFFVVWVSILFADRFYLFQATPDQAVAMIYPGNPFCEAVPVADYIKNHSAPDSRIAVLGSEPEIYFYAHRRSATGHVSTYILMKRRPYSHDMQEEMIREIKAAGPEYIVIIYIDVSWNAPYQDVDWTLLAAMTQYVKDHYTLVGVLADGVAPNQRTFYWDAEARNLPSHPQRYISVYKLQKPAAGLDPLLPGSANHR